jgi:nucleotide-binding universal stress UspA family protein
MDAVDAELERALRRLNGGRDAAQVAEELSRRLANKLLHAPTCALRGTNKEALMYQHILIPTDGSELADKAVSAGIDYARETGARVTLFTAVPEYDSPSEGSVMARRVVSFAEHARNSEERANGILAQAAQKAHAAKLRFDTDHVQSNQPGQAIIDAAQRHGCDAIFIASHGRGGISAVWHGSATREVLAHSKIPTLVLR